MFALFIGERFLTDFHARSENELIIGMGAVDINTTDYFVLIEVFLGEDSFLISDFSNYYR